MDRGRIGRAIVSLEGYRRYIASVDEVWAGETIPSR